MTEKELEESTKFLHPEETTNEKQPNEAEETDVEEYVAEAVPVSHTISHTNPKTGATLSLSVTKYLYVFVPKKKDAI